MEELDKTQIRADLLSWAEKMKKAFELNIESNRLIKEVYLEMNKIYKQCLL